MGGLIIPPPFVACSAQRCLRSYFDAITAGSILSNLGVVDCYAAIAVLLCLLLTHSTREYALGANKTLNI
jgi:hypothetical protein